MEKGGRMLRAAAVVLALCLLTMGGAEGRCVVKNQSSQPVVILPSVGAAVAVVVDVGASVVLQAPLQHCYVQNKHSGHKKGPVVLANGGIYIIVDALLQVGQVNLCVGSLLGGILHIGAVVLGDI